MYSIYIKTDDKCRFIENVSNPRTKSMEIISNIDSGIVQVIQQVEDFVFPIMTLVKKFKSKTKRYYHEERKKV